MAGYRHDEHDDSELFHAAVQDAAPLADRGRVLRPAAPVPPPRRRSGSAPRAAAASFELADGRGRAADLSRRVLAELAAGRIEVGARLDLHGHDRRAAALALTSFVARERARGTRCVTVITGRGLHSDAAPVLPTLVPDLLAERPEVLGFAPAPARLGGDGALLVLLRKP